MTTTITTTTTTTTTTTPTPTVYRLKLCDAMIIPLENWSVTAEDRIKMAVHVHEFSAFETSVKSTPWQWNGIIEESRLLYHIYQDTTVDWPAKMVTITAKKDWNATKWLPNWITADTEIVATGQFDLHSVLKDYVTSSGKRNQDQPKALSVELVDPITSKPVCTFRFTLNVALSL